MQFHQLLLTYFLKRHHKIRIQSTTIASFLQLVFYCQLTSLVCDTQNLMNEIPTLINLLNIFYYSNQIWRPYQILFGFQKFRQYCFIIPTLTHTILIIEPIYFLISKTFFKQMKSKNKKKIRMQEFQRILSITFQIYNYVISLYALDLFIISIVESTINQTVNIAQFTIIVILLLREVLLIFINIMCSESIYFLGSPLHRDLFSIQQFIVKILIIVSIYLNHEGSQDSKAVFHTLNIFIFAYLLWNESFKKPHYISKISIVILAYALLYNISYIISLFTKDIYQLIIVFLICPLFLNLVFYIQESNNRLIFQKDRNIENIYNNLKLLYQNRSKQGEQSFEQRLWDSKNQLEKSPFQSELILFNQKILSSSQSNKRIWYQKYLAIQFALMNFTETIAYTHNFEQSILYSEVTQQFVKTQFRISFLQERQLNRLKKDSYLQLKRKIIKNQEGKEQLKTYQFIQYKLTIQTIQENLINLFERKKNIYQNLLEDKYKATNQAFQECYKLSNDALKFKKLIKQEMNSHKTYQLQQLGVLMLAEFFNNILEAQHLQYMQFGSEEIRQNELEAMEFLSLKFNDDMLNIQIAASSSSFHSILGFKHHCNEFSSLFPDDFYSVHQKYIQAFLKSGKCRFLDNVQELIIRGDNNIIYHSLFSLSIEERGLDGIYFYCFFKLINDQPRALYLNKFNQIVGYTKTFLNLIKDLNLGFSNIYLMDINKLIPKFDSLKQSKYLRIHFTQNTQEFQTQVQEKYNLIEILIIENSYNTIEDLDGSTQKYFQCHSVNQESAVIQPIQFNFEEVMSPLSVERKSLVFQTLLQTQTQKMQTIKSNDNSPKESLTNKNAKVNRKDENQEQMDNDQASSKFSRGIFDNSIYSRQYYQLNEFLNEDKRLGYIQSSIILFIVCVLINLIFQIINLSFYFQNYQPAADSDMLAIKSKFMTPMHNCVTAQVCVINYKLLNEIFHQISSETAEQKSQFSYDSISKTYQNLKETFTQQLNNQNLLFLFTDQQIELTQVDGSSLISRNITLKNALYYYEEAQFFESWSVSGTPIKKLASNEYIYYMTNIAKMDNYFDILSEQVLDFVINNSIQFSNNQTTFSLKMIYLQVFFVLLTFSMNLKNLNSLSLQFKLFTSLNLFSLKKEIKKLGSLMQTFQQEQAQYRYYLEAATWEKDIQIQQFALNQKINQQQIKNSEYQPQKRFQFILLSCFLIVFYLPQFIIQQLVDDYFIKYQNTCQIIELVSAVSSAVTAVYELRDINYMINSKIPFFNFVTDEKRLEQNTLILQQLDEIALFLEIFPNVDYTQLLVDDQYLAFIQQIKTQSLCDFLINFSSTLANEHCDNIYQGVMNIGLFNTISKIQTQISSEYQTTDGFQIILRNANATFEEAEIGLITSECVIRVQNELIRCMIDYSDKIKGVQQILAIIYILICIFIGFTVPYFYLPIQMNQAKIIKNLVFLIPRYQFYLDQKFETNFRLLVMQRR